MEPIHIDEYFRETLLIPQPKHQLYGMMIAHLTTLCSIPQSSYVILGSYPMRKYKNIGDLDIDMDSSDFHKLQHLSSSYISYKVHPESQESIWEVELSPLYSKIKNESEEFKIEVYCCDPKIGYFGEEYSLDNIFGNKEKCVEVDEFGNQHYSLETTLVFKQKNNRPKDQKDIDILKNLLHKQ